MVDLYIEDSIRKNFLMKTFFLFGRKEVKGLLPNMHSDHRLLILHQFCFEPGWHNRIILDLLFLEKH